MSFATPLFLWYFLPTVLLAYWVLPTRFRNLNLAVGSLVFYALGGKAHVWLLLGSIVANFFVGLAIGRTRNLGSRFANLALGTAVGANLAVLAIWKYAGFASSQVEPLAQRLGWHIPGVSLALPLGISFFTFHCISYVVDVHRGTRHALRNPIDFTTYIAQFPQLVAGPIIRYHEIAQQLAETGRDRLGDFAAGMPRLALGLSKKVLVADSVAPLADAAFAVPSTELHSATAWIGIVAYTVQIYFDFSGYSDMAIGLGRMFGFTFPENFNRPYSAESMTDFWRRWHLSLSSWFRDYLYIPLGGNRAGPVRTYRNLCIVFLLTGLWHGANWTFVFWGLYHGSLLILERRTGLAVVRRRSLVPLRRAATMVAVMVGWVLFRSDDMKQAWHHIEAMFLPRLDAPGVGIDGVMTNGRLFWLVVGSLSVLLPGTFSLGRLLDRGRGRGSMVLRFALVALVAPYAAALVASGTFSPFLYFQF